MSIKMIGIGTADDGTYKTTDDGLTWELISTGCNSALASNGRIIFASQENQGLLYSDDNGATWEPSNIEIGNFDLINRAPNGKVVYVASLDGDGIYYTLDNGKYWTLSECCFGEWNKMGSCIEKGKDGNSYAKYTSRNLGVYFDNNYEPVYFGWGLVDAVTPDSNLSDNIDQNVVHVLNTNISPRIFLDTVGLPYYSEMGEPVMLLNEIEEYYYINANSKEILTSVIDWEEDVGMRKFEGFDLSDITDPETNITLVKEQNLKTTKKFNRTILVVKNFIEAARKAQTKKTAEAIKDITSSKDNILNDSTSTQEEKTEALKMQSVFEDVYKASSLLLLESLYDKVYNTSDDFVRKLIYCGIFESMNLIAGSLRKEIKDIMEKGSPYDVSSTFSINYSFATGLKIAFGKYLKSFGKMMKTVTKENDKDLIAYAADFYKTNRTDYVDQAKSILLKVQTPYENILRSLSTKYSKNLINEIEGLTGATLATCKQKIIAYINANPEMYITSKDFKLFMKSLKNSFKENFKKDLSIDFKYFEEIPTTVEPDESVRIYDYLEAIHNKFTERCLSLVDYCLDNELDLDSLEEGSRPLFITGTRDILTSLKTKVTAVTTLDDLYTLINYIDISNVMNPIVNTIIRNLKNSWINNKELI